MGLTLTIWTSAEWEQLQSPVPCPLGAVSSGHLLAPPLIEAKLSPPLWASGALTLLVIYGGRRLGNVSGISPLLLFFK